MPKKEKKTLIKNHWALIAQSSSVDQESNLLSISNVVEEVTLQLTGRLPSSTPASVPVHLQLISQWERDSIGEEADLKVEVQLKDPEGKLLIKHEGVIVFKPPHKRFRLRVNFQGMPVTIPGTYHFEVFSLEPEKTEGKKLIVSSPMEVKITYDTRAMANE